MIFIPKIEEPEIDIEAMRLKFLVESNGCSNSHNDNAPINIEIVIKIHKLVSKDTRKVVH